MIRRTMARFGATALLLGLAAGAARAQQIPPEVADSRLLEKRAGGAKP